MDEADYYGDGPWRAPPLQCLLLRSCAVCVTVCAGVGGAEALGTELTSQEECWPLITSFFDENKLVRQQLDSFDRFVRFTIGSIITAEENRRLIVQSDVQYDGRQHDVAVRARARARTPPSFR
jgi:hypothetical protein